MITQSVLGQQNLPGLESISKATDSIKSSLKLTDDQAVKFQEVNRQFISGLRQINQSTDNVLTRSKQRKELLLWREGEIKKIFTPEQYQQYRLLADKKRSESKKSG
jgi:hypothetical protein